MTSGYLKEGILDDNKKVLIADEPIVREKNCEEVPHHQKLFEEEEGTPRLGLILSTYEDVEKFYGLYAQRVGFGIMKRSSNHGEDGACYEFTLACDKEGKPRYRSKNPYHSRPSAKTNCKAKIIARLNEDGFYYLNHVHLEHNHVVSPSKSRFYKSNRRLSNHLKKNLEYNDDAGVHTNKFVQVWAKRMGGFDKLGFSEKKCRNYVEKVRQLKLGEKDNSLERSEIVNMHCMELAEVALKFGDRYDMVLKLIIELKESLLKEKNIICKSSQENHNYSTTLGGLGDVACGIKLDNDQVEENKKIPEKILNPIPVRRKGGPPSKRKQSIMEEVCTRRTKKVFPRKNKTSDGKNVEKHDTLTGTQVTTDSIVETNFTDLSGIDGAPVC